jgi:flagellar biosynthetic protein FliR
MTLGLPVSTIFAFLLVLARVGGLIAFLPIPGFKNAPEFVRVVLVIVITFALFPAWPALPNELPSFGLLTLWVFKEAGLGLAVGVTVGFLAEAFQMGMQILGLQAGYGYASTIDPTSQADSGVLQIVSMLTTGLLFLSLGFDRELFRVLALSLEKFPAGSWSPSNASLNGIVMLGGQMFAIGLRLALPVVALLLLIDVALALLGRMQQQLQLLSLAFPVKMMAAMAILAALTPVTVRMFGAASSKSLAALHQLIGL